MWDENAKQNKTAWLQWTFSELGENSDARTSSLRVPLPDFLRELRIGDQEAGDVVGVEEADEGVDFRVHNWLTH